jgi:hypothetical protein
MVGKRETGDLALGCTAASSMCDVHTQMTLHVHCAMPDDPKVKHTIRRRSDSAKKFGQYAMQVKRSVRSNPQTPEAQSLCYRVHQQLFECPAA